MKHLTDKEIQSCLHGLSDDEQSPIEHHLRQCTTCTSQLHFYQRLGKVVMSALADESHDGFELAVMAKLRAIQRFRRVADLGVASAAFVTIGLAVLIVFLAPSLKRIIADHLLEVWHIGTRLVTDIAQPSAAGTLVFATVLFTLIALLDRRSTERMG